MVEAVVPEVFGQLALGHYLILSAFLFAIGLAGFVTRRNMIVMFLCTELMFQAAVIALAAFGRFHLDLSGQVMVIFVLTIAAAEAAWLWGWWCFSSNDNPPSMPRCGRRCVTHDRFPLAVCAGCRR